MSRLDLLAAPITLGAGGLVSLIALAVLVTRATRRVAPRAGGPQELRYFVEYLADETSVQPAVRRGGELRAPVFAVVLGACLLLAGGVLYRGRPVGLGFGFGAGGEGGATKSSAAPSASASVSPAPKKTARPAPSAIAVAPRKASYFVTPAADLNGDGKVQNEERAMIHAELPLFVVVTVEDAGYADGLAWVAELLETHHLAGKVTWFLTGQGFDKKGGPVGLAWQRAGFDAMLGLGGTTREVEPGDMAVDKWVDELGGVQRLLRKEIELPTGWDWKTVPLGARAPFLAANDAWFQALGKLEGSVVYDSSIVVQGAEPPASLEAPRDALWPFTLHEGLPKEAKAPWVAGKPATVGPHPLWELPINSWALRAKGQPPEWQPSTDASLFRFHPCGEANVADAEAVAQLQQNLVAHYKGNRAPFHLGLRTGAYRKPGCARATIDKFLGEIGRRIDEGENIRFVDVPTLLAWIQKKQGG